MSATDHPEGTAGDMLLDTPITGVSEVCPAPGDLLDDEEDSFVFAVSRYSIYEIYATVNTGSIQLQAGGFDNVKHASFRGPGNS